MLSLLHCLPHWCGADGIMPTLASNCTASSCQAKCIAWTSFLILFQCLNYISVNALAISLACNWRLTDNTLAYSRPFFIYKFLGNHKKCHCVISTLNESAKLTDSLFQLWWLLGDTISSKVSTTVLYDFPKTWKEPCLAIQHVLHWSIRVFRVLYRLGHLTNDLLKYGLALWRVI